MKTVFSFDYASGAYAGPVELDDSDKSPLEYGVYLLPGNCVALEPPATGEGQYCKWNGTDWIVVDTPKPLPVEPVIEDPRALALLEIIGLEAQITVRRMREALLTGDNTFILAIEKKIVGIRKTLNLSP